MCVIATSHDPLGILTSLDFYLDLFCCPPGPIYFADAFQFSLKVPQSSNRCHLFRHRPRRFGFSISLLPAKKFSRVRIVLSAFIVTHCKSFSLEICPLFCQAVSVDNIEE